MKSKEVIKMLLELDPTGEVEVCVGNTDIFDIVMEPAYYDGCYQRLVRDPEKAPYYDIVGGEYISEGVKICIDGMTLKSALWNNPKLPIKFLDKGYNMDRYKEAIAEHRKDAQKWADGKEERMSRLEEIRNGKN